MLFLSVSNPLSPYATVTSKGILVSIFLFKISAILSIFVMVDTDKTLSITAFINFC
ncbi:hypothetical protein R2Q93_08960 [Clostridium perfringens]|nr:hypothetical protein [Clostridium perfringens]